MKPASASTPEADRPVSAGSALDEDPASNWTTRLMETSVYCYDVGLFTVRDSAIF